MDLWDDGRKLNFIHTLERFFHLVPLKNRASIVIDTIESNMDSSGHRLPLQSLVSWQVLYMGFGDFHYLITHLVPDSVEALEATLTASNVPVILGLTSTVPEEGSVKCHLCSANTDPATVGIAPYQCSYAVGGALFSALAQTNLGPCA